MLTAITADPALNNGEDDIDLFALSVVHPLLSCQRMLLILSFNCSRARSPPFLLKAAGDCATMRMRTALQNGSAELLKAFDVLGLPVFIVDGTTRSFRAMTAPARLRVQRNDVIGTDLERFLSIDAPRTDQGMRRPFTHQHPAAAGRHILPLPHRRHPAPDGRPVFALLLCGRPGGRLPACSRPPRSPGRAHQRALGIVNSSLSIGTIFRMCLGAQKAHRLQPASLLLYNEADDTLLIFAWTPR